jgi:uncharacterized protein YegP (UPF0339 family)
MEGMERDHDHLAEVDLTEDEIDAMMARAEPVEIVGPRRRRAGARFEVYVTHGNRYTWRLLSGSGRVLATGGETYHSKAAAIAAINEVREDARDSVLVD